MRSETISIIVPVFNGEKYIEECIVSILGQTYSDWELIIINDGSTDHTQSICEKYSILDARIRVLYQENQGVSVARNTGLDQARGVYVVFVDGDDVLPENSLQVRLELISNVDLVIGAYKRFSELSGTKEKGLDEKEYLWGRHEALNNIAKIGVIGYQGYIWNKIFRLKTIEENHIRFAENIAYNEDRLFCVEYVSKSDRIMICNSTIYYYRNNDNSAMAQLAELEDSKFNKNMSEFIAYDKILLIVKDYQDCYYLTSVEALRRAIKMKRRTHRNHNLTTSFLNRKIYEYGLIAMRAPSSVIDSKKKLKILGHTILRK